MDLKQLSETYFKQLGFKIIKSEYDFYRAEDDENQSKAILIKDWNRSIGINVIRHFHDQLEKLNITKGYVIGRNFAYQVKKYCEDIYNGKVKVITESEMKNQMGI